MSTIREIESALESLPPEQWWQIRRWMDDHAPKAGSASVNDASSFEEWLAASTGSAQGKLTTDERLRETRGED